MSKLWGGRFQGETDRMVEEFTASIGVDARLWEVDIQGSLAHVKMLGQTGILPQADVDTIIMGLVAVKTDIAAGKVTFKPEAEDVHSEIERLLTDKIGAVAGKLHTARSRNDQVATDTRLYLRGQVDGLLGDIRAFQKWIVDSAPQYQDTMLPGLTHVQHAQPVSLAHHLMAYFWMFQRDAERLTDLRKRVNQMPLGSAALAGTGFPINREITAKELGFEGICENSLDAVSDRDFIVEFLGAASLVMSHLSRLSEELILWSAPEHGFVELADAVTTGSSIMPQKKNPDVAELIRGRTGKVTGSLVSLLMTLKGLPLSYNRDLQEDKEALFTGLDTVRACVKLMHRMLVDARFSQERMEKTLSGDFSNATDLADYLAKKGMPFRQCHEVVGAIVRDCIQGGMTLETLTFDQIKPYSSLFEKDVLEVLPHRAVMNARTSRGGTSAVAVKDQIQRAKALLTTR